MKKAILIMTILIFASSGVFAQNIKTPKINKKQKIQADKIKQGVKSGELTHKETKKLLKLEAKLQKKKRIAKADGVITPKEKAKLRKLSKRLDGQIYKQKHDTQKRR